MPRLCRFAMLAALAACLFWTASPVRAQSGAKNGEWRTYGGDLGSTLNLGASFTNVPGGFPIEVGGEVIGAVAAGGAKIEQDVEVAKAALAALGL